MQPAYVNLTESSVDDHHLCCALGDPKHEVGVQLKKAWLKLRLKEGLVFRKLDVRGKVFIEYMLGEKAWRPIVAPGWMVIHCLWVSGQYAKQGHGRALLEYCIEDARRQGKAGVVVAAAKTKRPFLADPKFFRHFGFELVDTAGEFVLLALRLIETAPSPTFAESVKHEKPSGSGGFVARYTDQCPYNHHWAPAMVGSIEQAGYDVKLERLTTVKKAQGVKSPLGTFGLERKGQLVTHHLNTAGAVTRLLAKLED